MTMLPRRLSNGNKRPTRWGLWQPGRVCVGYGTEQMGTHQTVGSVFKNFSYCSKIYVWFIIQASDHHHHPPPELSHCLVLKLSSTQFCCETKTAPKNKVYWLKTKNRERWTYVGKQRERRQQQDAGSRKADEQKMTYKRREENKLY